MSTYSPFLHPADEVTLTMERIYRHRMTTTSGGNVSLREPDGSIWVTPSAVDKGDLRRDDIVCVHPDGRVEGAHKPSSELPFHQMIYRARPDIGGIVHAHAGALVAFSVTHRVPDTRLFHQSRTVVGEVGFVPYALPGSARLGQAIADAFAQGLNAVLLENHGAVVGGETLQQAFQRFETLEFAAKTAVRASMLGEIRYLSEPEVQLPADFTAMPSFERGPASSLERDLRRQICQVTQRGYRQRLFISTEGAVSARLDDRSFVITPYRKDRDGLTIDDLVLVQEGRAEAGKHPSRASRNHQAIYRRYPQVNAIVNATPVNATAFSVTGAKFDSRTMPESYLILRDVPRLPYGMQFRDPEALAQRVSPEQPVLLLENDGALVVGSTVIEAFDRLEVLESTAETLIDGRALGHVRQLPREVIDELSQAFLSTAAHS
jgi:L-fuculose-phosphate aldolase